MERQTATKIRAEWHPLSDGWPGYWRNCHDGQLRVLITEDPGGWHLSISHARMKKGEPVPGRYPTWDEIAEARYRFLPDDLDFVMHLPPMDEYVAVHPTTFHLHEHPER